MVHTAGLAAGCGLENRGRDEHLAKKRARVALIDRLERRGVVPGRGGVWAARLLAEVDLALSEADA